MNAIRIITTLFFLVGVFSSTDLHTERNVLVSRAPSLSAQAKSDPVASFGKLPIRFVPNEGQTDARVRYAAQETFNFLLSQTSCSASVTSVEAQQREGITQWLSQVVWWFVFLS